MVLGREVIGFADRKQNLRRIKRGDTRQHDIASDQIADLRLRQADDAIDRRSNFRIAEVEFRFPDRCFQRGNIRPAAPPLPAGPRPVPSDS